MHPTPRGIHQWPTIIGTAVILAMLAPRASAAPRVHSPGLQVKTVAHGLTQPIGMAFLPNGDMFVLEKSTGRVQMLHPGAPPQPVLDLAVNNAVERGLLGIALHPDFASNGWVYLYWTESTTGTDSGHLEDTPLLGNRVDRFVWDGTRLTRDINIIHLRALQPANPPYETEAFGNHNGGVLRFGPDGKLYILMGDNGRRGQMQNLEVGPRGAGQPDDQFGGPVADNAHFTGVVIRLNDDGTTPTDNPFYEAGGSIGGEAGHNIQRTYAYGLRNGFGMDFDARSGYLWVALNGDDSFDEIDRLEPGSNGGWIQVQGPLDRIAQFRAIETDSVTIDPVTHDTYFGLQQTRWSPLLISPDPSRGVDHLFMLPGATYQDPEFSWRFAVAPGALGFLTSAALGHAFQGDVFVGSATPDVKGGAIWRLEPDADRKSFRFHDARLDDHVADNAHKFDLTESESILFGEGFGVSTDIQTGPNGDLFVVSLDQGSIFEIARRVDAEPILAEAISVRPAGSGATGVHFELTGASHVAVGVFDVSGRHLRDLASGEFTAGSHDLTWDGRDMAGRETPAGVYFVRVETGGGTAVAKMIRLR